MSTKQFADCSLDALSFGFAGLCCTVRLAGRRLTGRFVLCCIGKCHICSVFRQPKIAQCLSE